MVTRCVICTKEIKKKDNYFKVELYRNGKLFGTDFAHETCWKGRNQFENQLRELVSGISNFANKNGILPERKVIVE